MRKAFLLGAGLGTRLRPLTQVLPKPLIPVFHRPLISYALDHCRAAGILDFAINTHHLPEKWEDAFPGAGYQGDRLRFFHEPELLETGGGLKNIEGWIGNDAILVYNGDILTDIRIDKLITAHMAGNNLVTLALRSEGPAPHVAVDGKRVVDIHRKLGVADGTHQFTGIYCVDAALLGRIPAGEKISIIPAFLELAREGLLGGYVLDDGYWLDLGTREAYLEVHQRRDLGPAVHPDAAPAPDAAIRHSVVGPGCTVESGAEVVDSVLWPGTTVAAGARLDRCILYSPQPATGSHTGADL
ncbi:MAG: NTP transferase domain-containing protein [Akkermansiaceae bacterium]|nr:NTP transferase domain-containing protein [Akkermansiaceae bacterium]